MHIQLKVNQIATKSAKAVHVTLIRHKGDKQMYGINRLNPHGMRFMITQLADRPHQTEIRLLTSRGSKRIVVNYSVEIIAQSWFDWVHDGHFIQNVFGYMTPDEREFIKTGITKEEWDEIFSQDNEPIQLMLPFDEELEKENKRNVGNE